MSPLYLDRKAPPEFEPRRGLDRRVGERRQRVVLVQRDRRHNGERRRMPDRREGAVSHLRNAIQLLEMVSAGVLQGDEIRTAAQAVAVRLWVALDEVERLHRTCTVLGRKVRLEDTEYRVRETNA